VSEIVVAKSTFPIMARLVDQEGEPVTQAGVSSISWAAYPEAGGDAEATGTLTPSNVIYDTLQTDAIWTKDDIGFNFRHIVGASVLTTAGTWRFEYIVTLATSGYVIRDEQVVRTKAPYTA
jgi:hypothetical protein